MRIPSTTFKALVVILLEGGNDANNMIVPMDRRSYAEYSKIRGSVALDISTLQPLPHLSEQDAYGLHPALVNVARLYSEKRAAVVCNVGPLIAPSLKQVLRQDHSKIPDSMLAHSECVNQWCSASAYDGAETGWGGRLADVLASSVGHTVSAFDVGANGIFTVGRNTEAISILTGGEFQPSARVPYTSPYVELSRAWSPDVERVNETASCEDANVPAAKRDRPSTKRFANDFAWTMDAITKLIAENQSIGTERLIFFARQGRYDTHRQQLAVHAENLQEFDQVIGSFFRSMDDLGLSEQVLLCTISDFNRTFLPNPFGGTDHGWGSHGLILGASIKGGQLLGRMPSLDLGGPDDLVDLGIWVPTTAVVQLASGIGLWMGLDASLLNSVFPELNRFPTGPLAI